VDFNFLLKVLNSSEIIIRLKWSVFSNFIAFLLMIVKNL